MDIWSSSECFKKPEDPIFYSFFCEFVSFRVTERESERWGNGKGREEKICSKITLKAKKRTNICIFKKKKGKQNHTIKESNRKMHCHAKRTTNAKRG